MLGRTFTAEEELAGRLEYHPVPIWTTKGWNGSELLPDERRKHYQDEHGAWNRQEILTSPHTPVRAR